jgi:hypothetical protein
MAKISENISVEWKWKFKDGLPVKDEPKEQWFITESSDDLKMPSFMFHNQEDAELAVAMAKSMQLRGLDVWNMHHEIKYVFRMLGLKGSGWED